MASTNEHTGSKQQTKAPSEAFRTNYDLIFRKDSPTEVTDGRDGPTLPTNP